MNTGIATVLVVGGLAWAEGPSPGSAAGSAAQTPVAGGGPNVYMAAGQVRPGAPVEGDFLAAGGRVIIDQPVKGDVMAAGGAVDLRAPLGDDLRAIGGDVAVDASVGGEVFAAGGSVTLARDARIERAATLYGSSVRVDARIGGSLLARGQRIAINGEIAGDVDLAGEQIALGPGARIGGKLRWASPNELAKSEGATVAGVISRVEMPGRGTGGREGAGHREGRGWEGRDGHSGAWPMMASTGAGWFGSLLTFLALLASGVLLLWIFPHFAAAAADTVRRAPGMALLLGFAALVAVPVLAVMLLVTILGIPLGIALFALYPLLLLGGYVVGVLFVARRALAALRPTDAAPSQAMTIGFFALALLLLTLLGRLPFVGGLVIAAVAVLGIGACVIEIHRRRQAGADPGTASGGAPASP